MAIRKKSETIHLRVEPISKALLEGLANSTGKTATQIVEGLVLEAAEKRLIENVEGFINKGALKNGKLDLKTALVSAHVDRDVTLTKLRTFYIAKEALSSRDIIIVSTIIEHEDLFFGVDEIFADDDELIDPDFISKTPKLNISKISNKMSLLEDYAEFREKNPNLKSTYKNFLTMIV